MYDYTFDPNIVHDYELDELDPSDPTYKQMAPEYTCQSDEFREMVLEEYQE